MVSEFKTIVNFIGEQPVPNYIPVKWAWQNLGVEKAISIATRKTREVGIVGRLNRKYELDFNLKLDPPEEVDPYDLTNLINKVENIVEKVPRPILNLTGGTKPMVFAGYHVAMKARIPFLYFQTEGGRMVIRMYGFSNSGVVNLSELVTIDGDFYNLEEYLQIHFDNFTKEVVRKHGGYFKDGVGGLIESQIVEVLESHGVEIFKGVKIPPDFQIDLFVKYGHNVGIVEVKKTLSVTAINQIAVLSRQVVLGTYIRRIVVGGPPKSDTDIKNILGRAELANTYVIQLNSLATGRLSQEDQERLSSEVKTWLERPTLENFQKMKQSLGVKD